MTGVLSGWSALIAPDASQALPGRPRVIQVGSLMSALVERAAAWAERDDLDPERNRLAGVLLDEIRMARDATFHLPMPSEPRIRSIAQAILDDPSFDCTLEAWAAKSSLSSRTARRLFISETGLTFNDWRQQARLVHALEMLARSEPVAVVADALGYATTSNFIAMFRRAFGATPGRYFLPRHIRPSA